MKGSVKFGLILLGVVLLLIGIIDMTSKKPIIWDRTFDAKDKNPFGAYVVRNELKHIIDQHNEDIKRPLYQYLDSMKGRDKNLLFYTSYFSLGEAAENKLLDYVSRGGKAMIIAEAIDHYLLDSLDIKVFDFYGYKKGVDIKNHLRVKLTNDNSKIHYAKSDLSTVFIKLPKNVTILGGISYQDYLLPNFVEVQIGKGKLYLHLTPDLFGNYYLLNSASQYAYAAKSLSYLNDKPIAWYDFKANTAQYSTPLRVLLTNAGLRQAWYVLLGGLVLLLVFKSKREQRAVEIAKPEPNLSKEFCETIATLYYENGTPGNMVDKKIDYFLHDIRSRFHMDTLALREEGFSEELAERSGVSLAETQQLIRLIIRMQGIQQNKVAGLKQVNETIEDFKHKAKMI
ncbi:hypothetical protein BWD42_15750 [Sphingobacterium sp. CZ-UAM]|uniref:DUF4350 domain-containing protein n=1 Tax=Sphingobacterium sp. CZ-UAM TaxID=1933868 RepID=UPI000985AF20|nr:DUF4350 domain-containing protein [Sphingobacterium sp. CZ-UAM]OOG17632.1 hypothetical protein BWD42_15750 [Sphingobacterium sp. CZ-UAM]